MPIEHTKPRFPGFRDSARNDPVEAAMGPQRTVEFDNLRLCIVRRPALSAGNTTKAIVGTLREFWRIVHSSECG